MSAEVTQVIVDGLVSGLIYALMAVGLTLIFGIMHVINFAHGEFVAIGGFTVFYLVTGFGINYYAAVAAATVIGMGVGALIDVLILSRMRTSHLTTTMLATIGVWLLIQNMNLYAFGSTPKTVPTPFGTSPLEIGSVSLTGNRLFAAAVAVGLIVFLHLFIKRTRFGKAMRATFQDRTSAQLMGIDVNGIYRLTFVLGAGLAATTGALVGAIFIVTPGMGDLPALKAFTVVIMGGLGNFAGAVAAGLILGVVESLGAVYVSATFKDAIAFGILILILMFRPWGLFGRRGGI
jgi:branched-chain amino acid transport system permease protein